jgi:thiol-disulfide isomerase/thioredoxin
MAIFLAAAVLLGAAQWQRGRPEPLEAPDRRTAMQDISVPQLDGGQWRLSDHPGQVVLVNYWATWCEPCREELPALIAIAQQDAPEGLAVVGISEDAAADAPAKVRAFVARYGIPYPIAFAAPRLGDPLVGPPVPRSVLLDRHGRIAKRYLGPITRNRLEKDVAHLLKDR